MNWNTLYGSYADMSEPVLRESVLFLTDVGMGCEVVDILSKTDNREIRLRLIEKAIQLGAVFTENDFARLDGEIPSAIYVNLARFARFEFGTGESVAHALASILDGNAKRAIYERAYIEDVKFTPGQLCLIGYEDIDSAHDTVEDDMADEEIPDKQNHSGYGCLGALIGLGTIFGRGKRRR